MLQTLYETLLWVSEANVKALLSGLRADFIDSLVRQPQAFIDTVNPDFNVLFISLSGLECSLLVLTVVQAGHGGYESNCDCTHIKGRNTKAWLLKAQVWGWNGIQEGCCDFAVHLIHQHVLQCKLESLKEAYQICLEDSHQSFITPSADVVEWVHQFKCDRNEDSKVKLDAICSLDVLFSFFFQSLIQWRFVPIYQEPTKKLSETFPTRNINCVHCPRCDGRPGIKPLHIDNGFEFAILNGSSSLLSFLRVDLVQEQKSTHREVITSILAHRDSFDPHDITAESLLAHIPTSLKGSMATEPPFSRLWLRVAVWSAPIGPKPLDVSILKETNLRLKYEVIALAKQARME